MPRKLTIPDVPSTMDHQSLYNFLLAIKENVEILQAQRSGYEDGAAVLKSEFDDAINNIESRLDTLENP
jgi:hypothetical protein